MIRYIQTTVLTPTCMYQRVYRTYIHMLGIERLLLQFVQCFPQMYNQTLTQSVASH